MSETTTFELAFERVRSWLRRLGVTEADHIDVSGKTVGVADVLRVLRAADPNAIDRNAMTEVEIRVKDDGKTIWVNIDGECALRIFTTATASITVADQRKRPKMLPRPKAPKTPIKPHAITGDRPPFFRTDKDD